jgi:hypothetical protein
MKLRYILILGEMFSNPMKIICGACILIAHGQKNKMGHTMSRL